MAYGNVKVDSITTSTKTVTVDNLLDSGSAVNLGVSLSTTSTLAVGQSSAAANTDLDVNGAYAGNVVAVSALDINCSTGNYFTKTISSNSTFTFSNVPSSRAYGFTLEVDHNGGTISWPAAVKWAGDSAPTLTTGKTHIFIFVTDNGGSRWRGVAAVDFVD